MNNFTPITIDNDGVHFYKADPILHNCSLNGRCEWDPCPACTLISKICPFWPAIPEGIQDNRRVITQEEFKVIERFSSELGNAAANKILQSVMEVQL